MRRRRFAVATTLLICFAACGESGESNVVATPAPISAAAITAATLSPADMGSGWAEKADAEINTVQIGGRIGATNISNPPAQATSAFTQKNGSGFLSNSVFLMGSSALAGAVIDAHVDAAGTTAWTQSRTEGGRTDWKIAGSLAGLSPPIGDQMFATKLRATITDAEGAKTERNIEYVVYRVDRLVGFVVAQDVGAAAYARKQETNIERAANIAP